MRVPGRSAVRLGAGLVGTLAVALIEALAGPSGALAHPLGNFTINHYAGLEVSATEIRLDVVLDRAEIPTFEERRRLDLDGDGEVTDDEAGAAREAECRGYGRQLELIVDEAPLPLDLTAAGLSFPPGAAGLSTMRLVCGWRATLPPSDAARWSIAFADRSFADVPGWREIVVRGDGTTIEGEGFLPDSLSARLTAYPADRLATPAAMSRATFTATPGGSDIEPLVAPDAVAIGRAPGSLASAAPAGSGSPGTGSGAPGGVAAEIPAIFQATDLSPRVLLLALLTAVGLGAFHSLTPGHGKTLMAAYLVGRRGTAIHAAALALAVAASHTAGLLLLAVLIALAGAALPAQLVTRWLPVVAAATIAVIGAWMLAGAIGERRARDSSSGRERHDHPHDDGLGTREGRPVAWASVAALGLAGGIIPSTSALVILLTTVAAGRPAFGFVLVVAFGIGMAAVMAGLGLALVLARDRVGRLTPGARLERARGWLPIVAACVVLGAGVWLTGQAIAGGSSF